MIQISWNRKYIFQILKASDFVSKVVLNQDQGNLQRQAAVLDLEERSHFRRIKLGYSIYFELYCIHTTNGALSHQKVFRKNKEVKLIFKM